MGSVALSSIVSDHPLDQLDVSSQGLRGERMSIQPVGKRVAQFYIGYAARHQEPQSPGCN